MKLPWYSLFSFLFFCLETTVKKNTWMRTISITVMEIISNVLLWRLFHISYVQSYFSTFARHIDNGIWKTPFSWRFYSNGSTYVPILNWLNITKLKWAKVPGRLSFAQKSESVLWRAYHLLFYSSFFFQKNLDYKINFMLME